MPSLKRDPRLSSIVERTLPLTRASTSGLDCSSKNLLDALADILNIIPNYTLIVDGLDEYAGPHHRDPGDLSSLLRFLRKAGSRSETRIILLSRTGAFPEDVYSGMIRLLITNSDVNPDIVRYLEKEIEDNCYLNPDLSSLRSEIISKVPMRCQGMFLLARFLMENLKTANANEITTTLNEFPSQLTEFYQQELKTVAENLRDNEKKTQRSILLVLIGSYETFSVQTLAKILALDTEQNSGHHNGFGRAVAPVLRLCRPLVHVVNSQVQFVHESARDFLLKFVLTDGDSDEFLARKSLVQLSERKYTLINYPARLLRRNLLRNEVVEQGLEPTFEEPAFYRYACLHWQEHLTALKNPPNDILDKISRFLVGIEFVSWSETLFQLKPKSGISSQIQVKTMVTEWYERLPPDTEEKIPIQDYFVKAHETLSSIFADRGEDKLLPYLPLVRLGQYFNVGGRTDADFQRAYDYKMTVAAGFERDLGPRNPLTLRAKTEVFKEFFFQKRFDEAVSGLKAIARIQLEVTGEDVPDYFITLQLFGLALLCVTKYEKAVVTLREAARGFRKLSGDDDFNTLVSELYEGYALAREAKLEEASKVHRNALELWLPIGGPDHPFSLMLKTALGATYRQLERFSESEQYLLESLTARKRLFTKDNITYIDSVLQLATLYYSSGRSKESLESLGFISSSDTLKVEFERQCQVTHIRALIDIRNDKLKMAKTSLQQLVDKGSGKARDKNNRELLWARITLADLLRRCNEDDESLMVFTELVTSSTEESSISQNENQEVYGYSFPSSLADEPESPAQLAIAEKALRLVRDAKKEEAERVLRANGLKWQRRADFWILQGGPITDTASISGLGDR
jgi:tetratricopeptide (TPR) repeat protein